jgi:hypothetical protein
VLLSHVFAASLGQEIRHTWHFGDDATVMTVAMLSGMPTNLYKLLTACTAAQGHQMTMKNQSLLTRVKASLKPHIFLSAST